MEQGKVTKAMAEVEEKARAFTEAHRGESAEDILAQMRGEEPASEDLEKAYTEYASERLKLVRQDISGSSYSRDRKMSIDIFDGYQIEDAFEAGAKWQREQIVKHDKTLDYYTFENGEKHFAQYILEMIANGWHMEAIKSACKDKIMEKQTMKVKRRTERCI